MRSMTFHPQAFNFSGCGAHFGGNRFTISMSKDHFTSLMASGAVIPYADVTYLPPYEMWGFQAFEDTVYFFFRGRDGKD